jgi:O-acetyl-ADP-ribose deacetylase (regulator of RNase III)
MRIVQLVRGNNTMIQAIAGNIFDSHAQTLVNAVNCAGVMGKGIALEFKKRFPAMYKDYR